jgi:hypothetical protein
MGESDQGRGAGKTHASLSGDSGFGAFHTNYGLSQREIDLLVSWVEGGAPKGDVKDLPQSRIRKAWALVSQT